MRPWSVLLLSLALGACAEELPHDAAMDPASPPAQQARARLTGRIVLEGESDASQVSVQLIGAERTYSVETLADGVVALTGVVPGTYTLAIGTRYFTPVSEPLAVALGETVDLGTRTLAARRAAVSGKAFLQDRTEKHGRVEVRLARVGSVRGGARGAAGAYAPMAAAATGAVFSAVSGDDGAYTVTGVPAGVYAVTATRAGVATAELADLSVTGEDGDVTLDDVVLLPMYGFVEVLGKNLAGAVSTATVSLRLTSTGSPSWVRVGFDPLLVTAGAPLAMRQFTDVELPAGDGAKTVYVQFEDARGNQSAVGSDAVVLDTTPPAGASASLGVGAVSRERRVPLAYAAAGAVELRAREGATCGGAWQPMSDAGFVDVVSPGDGLKHLRVQYRDDAGNATACLTRSYTLDTAIAPFTVALTAADGGVVRTAAQAVTVSVTGADAADAVEMRVSNLVGLAGAGWEPLRTSFQWALVAGDGAKTVFVELRDRAGNTAAAQASITLDQTPPNAPAVQVIDVDGDGYALAATQVELRWSVPAGASRLELERFVAGAGADFVPVAAFAATAQAYVDAVTQPGYVHHYRMCAVDDVGNRSAWSLVAQARPYLPATTATWVRDTTGAYRFTVGVNPGTFVLTGYYAYEDATGTTVTQRLVDNQPVFDRPGTWARYNDRLLLRTTNADNSLVYDTVVPLNVQNREAVDALGDVGSRASLALDAAGNPYVVYVDLTQGALKFATRASGAWVSRTLVKPIDTTLPFTALALDAAGHAHVVYFDYAVQSLVYLTDKSGAWVAQTAATGVAFSGSTAFGFALDAAGKVHLMWAQGANADLNYATNAGGAWATTAIGLRGGFVSIGVDAAGKVHAAHVGVLADAGKLMYLTNASGSWAAVMIDATASLNNTALRLDAAGKLHVAYGYNGTVKYVTNAGGGWSAVTVDSVASTSLGRYLSLALDTAGGVFIVYNDETNGDVKFARKNGTWSVTKVDVAGNVGTYVSAAAQPNGRVHAAYYDITNADLKYLTLGAAERVVWQADAEGNQYRGLEMAVDGQGRAHLVVQVDVNDFMTGDAVAGYLAPAGETWTPTAVNSTAYEYIAPALALDDGGHAHVLSYAYGAFTLRYSTNASGPWLTADIESGWVTSPRLAVDRNGKVHAAYVDGSGALVYTNNVTGTWAKTLLAASASELDVAVDAAGRAHLAVYEGLGADLLYLTNASGRWVTAPVDSAGDVGTGVRIALAGDGRAHVAYLDHDNRDVKHATNAGGRWTTEIVDADGGMGYNLGLAVDAAGRAHVTYNPFLQTGYLFKYATNAGGRWVSLTLDAAAGIGGRNAVALDARGDPQVAYDRVGYTVKVLKGFTGTARASSVLRTSAF